MKKPSKKQQLIKEDSDLLDLGIEYSPEDFENIASQMKYYNIEGLEIIMTWDDVGVKQRRLETTEEAEVRYHKEIKKWEKWKTNEEKKKLNRKKKLIKEAEKLGLRVEELEE